MAKPEDERESDETTVIGGQQAWSAADRPQQSEPPIAGEPPAEAFAGNPSDPGTADDGDRTVVIEGSWSAPDPSVEPGPSAAPVPPGGPVPPPGQQAAATDPATSGRHGKSELDKKQPELPAKPRRSERKKKDPVIPPGPVLVAENLGLLTPGGWVFRDISLTLRPSSVVGIVGPAGTGRSSLLLALTGRMEANTGTLTVAGHSAKDKPSAIRALTAVARIGSVITPEPALTVRQSIDERCLLDDVDPRIGRARFDEACAAMRLKFEPTVLVGSMVGDQATLLSVALACVRVSAVIVLDDLDRGVSTAVQQTMTDALVRLARTGPTIILTTTDRIPVMACDVVLDLTPKEGAAMWHLEAPEPVDPNRQLDPVGGPGRPQLGTAQEGPTGQVTDPYARWKPGYTGDPGDEPGPDDENPDDQGQYGPGPYEQGQYRPGPGPDDRAQYGPGPYDQGGPGPRPSDERRYGPGPGDHDPRYPDPYGRDPYGQDPGQRDAPTEDPR